MSAAGDSSNNEIIMRISTIAFANLKRRKGKALFLIIGIAIGIGTAVALLSLSGSIKEEIGSQLDQFGANIVVVPQSNNLSLNYGGVSVSSVSIDEQQLKSQDATDLLDIPYRNRLSIVAPKLLRSIEVEGKMVVMARGRFRQRAEAQAVVAHRGQPTRRPGGFARGL